MSAITVRTPLRICLAGGATDCPGYFRTHGGCCLSACIDKYLTVAVQPNNRMVLPNNPQHPYALAAGWTERDFVKITSDVPSGSGMGGSGALMVGLLKARWPELQGYELAQAAYNIERYTLGKPIGYQDAVVAAYGGCVLMEIDTEGRLRVQPFDLPCDFADRLLLMHTGIQRDAGAVLVQQARELSTRLVSHEAMRTIQRLGHDIYEDLFLNDGRRFGEFTRKHWEYKRATCEAVTTPQIDAWVELALTHGAEGIKNSGAGGGGYLLVVCQPADRLQLIDILTGAGLTHTPFRFVDSGVEVLT